MGVIRKKINRAVFLDRDGVLTLPLIRDGKGYAPNTLDEFEILPEARKACELLKEGGFLLVVVTNQPDVGRGILSLGILEEMHRRLRRQLPLDDVLVCTDPSESPGPRRKPAPGMLLEAAVTWDLDLTRSFMVGDRKGDIDAGRAAGCRCIFIDRGYLEAKPLEPDVIVGNVLEGARWVLHNRVLPV